MSYYTIKINIIILFITTLYHPGLENVYDLLQRGKTSQKMGVLGMTLNCISW